MDFNCWNDFKLYTESLPNTKSMGDAFEQLTKLYFQINPLYESIYDNIWLIDEVPEKDLQYLELPRQDLGIDLIAKSGKEYHAIQCKYHSNKNASVTNKEVATFTSLLANKKKLKNDQKEKRIFLYFFCSFLCFDPCFLLLSGSP